VENQYIFSLDEPDILLPLQTGLRCKIVKTKEFPAKSSRIRSYGQFCLFWQLSAGRRCEEDV